MNGVLRINDLDNAERLLFDHNIEIGRDLPEAELKEGIRKFLSNGEVLGFVENDHIIAMLNLYCNHLDTRKAYICNVYVLEEYRRKRLAERMMRRAIEICKERAFKSVSLHVSERNVPAVSLYTKLGFEYTDGYRNEDREMELDITPDRLKKRLMVLGAGGAQLILIKESKALGYYTIVCDMRPEMEGSKIADKYYQIDYMDLEGVYAIAVEEKIDGIISNSEPAMVNVAYISQKLNLIGNSVESIESLVSKYSFRELQKRAGVFAPNHYVVDSSDELIEKAHIMKYPVIIKPTESTGTQGTTKLDKFDEKEIIKTYDICKNLSRNNLVSIEEYVPIHNLVVSESDVVVIGNEFIWDGMMSTRRSEKTPMLPETYIFPVVLSNEPKKKIQTTIENIMKTAGIKHGEYNVEAYLTDEDEVFVIEINPRQGGNFIPELIKQHSGINLSKLIVSTAVGDKTYYNELKTYQRDNNYVTLHVVYARQAGIFEELFISSEIQPYVKWKEQKIEKGVEVAIGTSVFDGIACIDLQFDSYEMQHYFTDRIEEYIYPIIRN
jgi:biotin carboxylase/GNAT superfamily N-acetyltransferase